MKVITFHDSKDDVHDVSTNHTIMMIIIFEGFIHKGEFTAFFVVEETDLISMDSNGQTFQEGDKIHSPLFIRGSFQRLNSIVQDRLAQQIGYPMLFLQVDQKEGKALDSQQRVNFQGHLQDRVTVVLTEVTTYPYNYSKKSSLSSARSDSTIIPTYCNAFSPRFSYSQLLVVKIDNR